MESIDPVQGEIWLVNLNPTKGDEISKVRPCVVVSNDDVGKLALRMVVPITEWKDRFADFPWMTILEPDDENGLTKTGAADSFQVRSVSISRFVKKRGVVAEDRIDRIVKAISACVRTPTL